MCSREGSVQQLANCYRARAYAAKLLLFAVAGCWGMLDDERAFAETGDFECTFDIALYDAVNLASTTFSFFYVSNCSSPVPDAELTKVVVPTRGLRIEGL
jgi:hypothetical protein